jgi:hypothetical protein
MPCDIGIEHCGNSDNRSYRVRFEKITNTGFSTLYRIEDGVREIAQALNAGTLAKTRQTVTLDWYKDLTEWHTIVKETEMHGGILDI